MTSAVRRVTVIGASGMVGRNVVGALARSGHAVMAVSRREPPSGTKRHVLWDIAAGPPPSGLRAWGSDVIIHAAAFTDVDAAEDDPAEARRVNVDGFSRVAEFASAAGARVVFLSTDSVFDGRVGGYTESDEPKPLNVYAATKRDGELIALQAQASLVVRFNVFGPGRLAWWILQSISDRIPIDVYSDVRFNPLEVRDVADVLTNLALSDLTGICHLGADETLSKHEFAERLVAAARLDGRGLLRSVRLADRQKRAVRPLDTSLRPSARAAEVLSKVPGLATAVHRLAEEFRARVSSS